VLRVYLDQWVWIRLARAFHGRESERDDVEVLELAQAAVALGIASFPLSLAHYVETYTARNAEQRRRLAEAMADLSTFHALAPENVLVVSEVDAALHRRFGSPAEPDAPRVFGFGVAHALGEPGAELPAKFRRDAHADDLRRLWEFYSLAGPQPEMDDLSGIDMESWKKPGVVFMEAQERFAKQLKDEGFGTARKKDAVCAQELVDLLERGELRHAMQRARIPEGRLFESADKDDLTRFLEDIPTRDVAIHLRLHAHSMAGRKWTRTDLMDIGSLGVAVPYCDAVATEAQWVDGLHRARLDEKYETTLLGSMSEVRSFLLSLV
jgi:hypothetical protein